MFIWNKSSDTVWFNIWSKIPIPDRKTAILDQKIPFGLTLQYWKNTSGFKNINFWRKIWWLFTQYQKKAIFRSKTNIFDKKITVNRFLYPGLLSWISFSFEFSDARVCPAYKRVNKSIFQFKFINFLHLLYGDWPSGGRNSRMGMQGGSIWEEEDPQGTKKHNSITIRTMN